MNTFHRLAITVLAFTTSAEAASLKQAEFTRVINDVRLLPAPQQALPAKVGDKITGTTAVSTGVASRAELRFPDKTLTRIGSNSVFKLDQANRTLSLEQGVILLQVPKQIGGAKVRTAAVTAAVTGTSCMVERTPDGFIKIIVLEGVVDVYFNNDRANLITLVDGDILIFKENATEFPQPAKVDLELLKKTSKLMDPTVFDPLINQKQLADALDEQGDLKNKGELLKTAFEIVGRGTQITLTNEARREIFKTLVLQDRDVGGEDARDGGNSNGAPGGNGGVGTGGNAASGNAGTGTPSGPGGNTNSGGQSPPAGTPATQPIFNVGTTVFGNGSSIVTNPHVTAYSSAAGAVVTMQGTIYRPSSDGHFNSYMYGDNVQSFPEIDGFLASHGNWFAFKGDDIFIAGDVAVDTANGPRNIALGAVNSVTISQDATNSSFPSVVTDPSWTLPPSVDALLISTQNGSITMDSSFSLYGSGGPQDVFFYAYGPTSDVVIGGSIISDGGDGNLYAFQDSGGAQIYVPEGTFTAHAGQDVSLVNGATVEAGQVKLSAGRDVNIQQSTVRARTLLQIDAIGSIKIQNSSQLASLPTEVESLSVLLKAKEDIAIGDEGYGYSSVQGANVEAVSTHGNILIHDSSIIADVIKARVMSTGGELLISNAILGRDSPAAGSLIKLYGEGASGVRFSGDNTLNANSVDIAGQTVTIDAGGRVKLYTPSGSRVWTDVPNFNDGSHGTFTDSTGAIQHNPHAGAFGGRPTY